jgi:hypothetical protein
MKITICGAGNAAQTLIALLVARGEHSVIVYAPLADEAERLRICAQSGIEVRMPVGDLHCGRPALVTADAVLAADADLILMALPAFAHESVLRTLAPHLPPHVWIGALPARGGFDWMAEQVLGRDRGERVIFGLQTLPWACRILEWGRRVDVLGVKHEVDLAVWPSTRAEDVAQTLSALIGVALQPISGFLALTLANTGQIIHPGIMYGLFHRWDGRPFTAADAPLFYGGVNQPCVDIMQAISDEIQQICRALEVGDPHLDLSGVLPVETWLHRAYAGQIEDRSSLRAAFNTNRAYAGLSAPVTAIDDDRCVPAFHSRYLSEDIPYGLLVSRGIAELIGVATPAMDRVIHWAQERLGCEYLIDGRVAGRDLKMSRAPQRYEMKEIKQL